MAVRRLRPQLTPVDQVRAEAARRMMALVGARDERNLATIIANGTREAVRLQNKRLIDGLAWTPDETARATELRQVDAAIEAIRAASNLLEANPPADIGSDVYWPTTTGPA